MWVESVQDLKLLLADETCAVNIQCPEHTLGIALKFHPFHAGQECYCIDSSCFECVKSVNRDVNSGEATEEEFCKVTQQTGF
jgi:hypothetical protein